MKKFFSTISLSAALFCSSLSIGQACTDFRLSAQDGTVMITRSMEFALELNSNVMTSPRGRTISDTAPNGKAGMSWKTTYGYVFLDGLNTGIVADGMNEQGLSVEGLYLPGETQYQTVPDGQESHAVSYLHFGDWVLGNFKTVEEVRQALAGIFVFAQALPQFNNLIFPLHYAIYDSSGKGMVVEFVGGKVNIFDNLVGIMTNSPTYDWHIANLRNYISLTPITPKPVVVNGITFAATGQGAGMVGLPGDISPPSRFVKVAVMLKTVLPPKNAEEALNIAQHIINNVDIPLGFVREAQKMGTATNELTQWVVFKDLTHKMFYYRTYGDLTLHAVDLSKINFAENTPQLKMPIASKPYIMDMTQQLMDSKV
ncbi:MAG: choloylglycine hydrolase family protein [Gammaproteobacteria bacterium]|nr:MAG: choloylglycine hydrolase family protein [Gammaproteobacteria bacterium]